MHLRKVEADVTFISTLKDVQALQDVLVIEKGKFVGLFCRGGIQSQDLIAGGCIVQFVVLAKSVL